MRLGLEENEWMKKEWMKEWKIREERLDKGLETPHQLKKDKMLKNKKARKMRLESVKEK